MDEFLHHPRNPTMIRFSCKFQPTMVFHGFQVVRNGFRNHPQYHQGKIKNRTRPADSAGLRRARVGAYVGAGAAGAAEGLGGDAQATGPQLRRQEPQPGPVVVEFCWALSCFFFWDTPPRAVGDKANPRICDAKSKKGRLLKDSPPIFWGEIPTKVSQKWLEKPRVIPQPYSVLSTKGTGGRARGGGGGGEGVSPKWI